MFRVTLLPCPSGALNPLAHCVFQLHQTFASSSKPRETQICWSAHDTFLTNGKMLPDEIPGLQAQADISNTRNFQTLQATTSGITTVIAGPGNQTDSFSQPDTWITPTCFVHHIRTQGRTALRGQWGAVPWHGPPSPVPHMSKSPPVHPCLCGESPAGWWVHRHYF